jgi:L-fuculose-phosphate aldolase
MSKVTHRDIRQGIVRTCRDMNRIGLNQGTSGNLSHRVAEGLLITPTSLPYDDMGPKDIVEMAFDGTWSGRHRPSSEWRFHRDILKTRSDANVVLHTHSTYATTLAVHGKPIPAFHYMVAVGGGTDIRCSPYACFGTQDLSDHALAALDGRLACLLGHHGLIVLADTFEKALWRAVEIETLAKMYVHALAIGEPPRLTRAQMAQVFRQMKRMSYGEAPGRDGPPAGERGAGTQAAAPVPALGQAEGAAPARPARRGPAKTKAPSPSRTGRATRSSASGPARRKQP